MKVSYISQKRKEALNMQNKKTIEIIEKTLVNHQKDPFKAKMILESLMKKMKKQTISLPTHLNKYIQEIEKSISKEDYISLKKDILNQWTVFGLFMTMSGYIVLMFCKEFINQQYLISFSFDLLIAIIAFYITLHNVIGQYKMVQLYKWNKKITTMLFFTFVVSIMMTIIGAKNPFDISFLILVIGFITNKKMVEKQLREYQ